MSEIVIENGTVMTVNDQNEIYPSGYVHLIGDRIAEVGPGAPPDEINKNVTETIDAAGFVVMPGMTNAHVHLQQTLIRGLSDDCSLLPWSQEIDDLLSQVEGSEGHHYHLDPETRKWNLVAAAPPSSWRSKYT